MLAGLTHMLEKLTGHLSPVRLCFVTVGNTADAQGHFSSKVPGFLPASLSKPVTAGTLYMCSDEEFWSSIHHSRLKYTFVELFLAPEVGEVTIPEAPVTHTPPPSTAKGLCRAGGGGRLYSRLQNPV